MAIQKRKDKAGKNRYTALIDLYLDNGDGTIRRKQESVGTFATKREAEAAEAKALERRDRGTLLERSTATVGDVLQDWIRTKAQDLEPNTVHEYETTIRTHILPALAMVPIQRLTHAAVQSRINAWRAAGLSPRMIRSCYLRLRSACEFAVRLQLIHSNPCLGVIVPKLERAPFDMWSAEEARAFLDGRDRFHATWEESEPNRWLVPSVLWDLLLREGMRRGEALGLRWSDVDLKRGTAHIVQSVVADRYRNGAALIQERTKTAAGARTVRLTTESLMTLNMWRSRWLAAQLKAAEWDTTDLIVCTAKGGPVNPANVDRSLDKICAFAGVRRIKPHALRHTAASLMLAGGVNPKIAQERLGHSSIATTLDLYSHLAPDAQEQATDAMSRILGRSSS